MPTCVRLPTSGWRRGSMGTPAITDDSHPGALAEDLPRQVLDLVSAASSSQLEVDDLDAYEIISAEEQVSHYVRTGDIDALMRMPLPQTSLPPEGITPLEHLRYLLVSLNAICLHAALDGGVSRKVAYGLNRQFALRIMRCATEQDLVDLTQSRIIMVGYGLLVSTLTLSSVTDKDVVKAIRFIHDHHHDRFTVSDVAEHVGLSSEYFSAKFKRETGMTVSAYITQTRIKEAQALLRFTNLSIGEVAAQLSYSSQSHFQSAFKRVTGMTPQQYRMSGAV